jgi:hypothetical protein
MTIPPLTHSDAVISDCKTYRYRLDRVWGPGERLGWCMLNPSKAGREVNDPTVVRCAGFTKDAGYDGMTVFNLYARRATDPNDLVDDTLDNVGPRYWDYIEDILREVSAVVCAWGANIIATDRARIVTRSIQRMYPALPLLCLGTTKAGAPRHPLYLPLRTELVAYTHAGLDEDTTCW